MWQAYGHNGNGLCLVLRKETMLGQTARGLFPVHWCPIEYDDRDAIRQRVIRRLHLIQQAISATQMAETLPPQALGMLVAGCVVQLVLGQKNVAFDHEKEIRFVRSRLLRELVPPEGAGYRTVTIAGKRKNKFVLPLRYYPEFSIDASLPALLDHIIIGPSNRQQETQQEISNLLSQNGLGHVQIRLSNIPYRATA